MQLFACPHTVKAQYEVTLSYGLFSCFAVIYLFLYIIKLGIKICWGSAIVVVTKELHLPVSFV